MKKLKNNIFFIFYFIFSLNFNGSLSAIPLNEYNCYVNFIQKFNLVQNYPSSNGVYAESLFCSKTQICHSNGSISELSPIVGNNDVITLGKQVVVSDIDCFPFLTKIALRLLDLSNEFIYYKFPTVTNIILELDTFSDLSQKLPPYDFYQITTTGILNIKMSHLNDIKTFILNNNKATTNVEVDSGADKTNLKSLTLNMKNFPNFSGYQFDKATFIFGTQFNPSEVLTNFQYLNASNVHFTFPLNINYQVPFYLHLNTYIKVMNHYIGYFLTPTQFYDLSSLVNYESIRLGFVGKNFLYQNKIPVKVSPNTNFDFSLDIISPQTPPQIPPITDVGFLKAVGYTDSYLSGNLPEYNGQGSAYIYSKNQLTGTIPESWCGTALFVTNNQLTGTIPSCFSCYLSSTLQMTTEISGPNSFLSMPTMFDRFAGNSFTNLDKTIPCTTYRPQVKYHNQTTIIISGIDIGHHPNYYFLGSMIVSNRCKPVPQSIIRYGYEYYCNQDSSLLNMNSIQLINIGNNINYNFALVSKPPTFTSIITTENNKVSAVGTFFSSYLGQSEQTITIAGTNCPVTKTGFTDFTCITSVTLSPEKQLVVIKNDNQTKKVFAVFENNRLNNKQCPNDCVGSPSGDICDLSTGTCCICNTNYIQDDCSELYIPCPNDCSSHGKCDTNTGICKCDANYIHNDCSELYIPCPNDCSSHGQCNTNTGICKCNTNYIQDDCSELYIPCPNNCSSHGQCNTNTGICQCNTNYIQDDCSELYIPCPNDCSSHGQCNTNTGLCKCDTNYIHDDCSELYIPCPNDCSSHGQCNTNTGICKCDDNYIHDDCSELYIPCPNDCSSHGKCNTNTGICKCDDNYIHDDCSELYIECPNNCSSHGQCNTNTGICKCDDNYIHDDCSELYIPCPNDCSSHGQCNTNTGTCQCNTNYIQDDCSELYIKCPNDCSSLGKCNTNTGICKCDDNYIHDDCSELYIPCPNNCKLYIQCLNNCSSHGQCNTNTGICKCDDNYIQDDCSILYIPCPNDCSSHGQCNTNTGICKCDDNYIQDDCSELYIECPNDCSSHGQCNTNTGICKCDDNYIQDDCSELYIECADPICSSQGHCNTSNGICDCSNGFGGDECEFSQHYITSVNPSNENGGEASFYGSFGEQHNQLSVIIGSKTCPVTHSSNDLINCTAPPGKGIHSVNITQNNIVYIGKDIYIYSKVPQNIFECPKNCSSHGKCNTSNGKCECYLGYTSFDCGSIIDSGDNTTSNVDNSTGIVDINNEKINFKIYLKSLNEIDINNKVVKSYPLVSDWTVNKTQSNIYTFEQSPNKDEFKVISTIEQIENDRSVSFAGIDFLLTNNSIKFTVSIKNYKYQSFLNTLQLEMQSNTTELTNDDCNSKETQLDTENLKHQYDLSYIKLSKNNVDFVGRFVNKVVSDSKPTFLTTSYTKLNDSVTIILHLPHCVNECLIDPDFSVLLSPDFSDCESSKENIKWQIPVGVVVGVVGASCLGILFYKRKSVIKVNGQKIEMKSAKNKV
ncbi:hypothetical protein DICPUDRAFT_39367 [Dictyostelium purpureum]|uniref:EGF-like domain-containing protein n=1 Tax=Dictyostelium purpureum TaxID=5786 RepID=F0ZW70_DICPU|nr:uncharacterized protein DICPUDRAFT_39367 [Dictyostelium purpureum]EGC31797.1 hypothetical protein DICPUDRAFT_39367 [Dictyostelium purpureum]|eukprot:XP_003291664.1 hypothetical protein DICPUDRAFT_39367 [Dictyostelium purpureum]